MAKKLDEETKLVRFFLSKAGDALGGLAYPVKSGSPAETAIRAIKSLQRELKEAKSDAAEMLNNQRETIAELQEKVQGSKAALLWIQRKSAESQTPQDFSRLFTHGGSVGHRIINAALVVSPVGVGTGQLVNEAIKEASKAGKKTRR